MSVNINGPRAAPTDDNLPAPASATGLRRFGGPHPGTTAEAQSRGSSGDLVQKFSAIGHGKILRTAIAFGARQAAGGFAGERAFQALIV